MNASLKKKFANCKLLIMDFDGVLTDDKLYINGKGEETVRCSRADGMGLQKLREKTRIRPVIISASHEVVVARAERLKIEHYVKIDPKVEFFKEYVRKSGFSMEETCYVGNDYNDVECLKIAGMAIGVKDAYPHVLDVVDYVTTRNGGDGAIREVCELLIQYGRKN